jgi:NitT/TauT family transport system ATP-binding protein
VLVDGQPVAGRPPSQLGYVFQKDTVFPWRSVARNIALGVIGIVMALGIKRVEARLLRWRPEHQRR